MVERSPKTGRIIFSPTDRANFELPETMSPTEAVEEAQRYENLANHLLDGALGVDVSITGGRNTRAGMEAEAKRYGKMAAKIFDLCPEEHLELLAQRELEV